jgi:hypothetical protein
LAVIDSGGLIFTTRVLPVANFPALLFTHPTGAVG